MSFEKYWKENKDAYINKAKELAMQDYKDASLGKLYAQIDIGTDDDFAFKDGETRFFVYGETKRELIENSIIFLKNLKIIYGSESKWEWLQLEAIERLRDNEVDFSFGGNQEIDFHMYENTPSVELSKNKIKP